MPSNFDVPLSKLEVKVKGKRDLFQRLVEVYRKRSGLPIRAGRHHAWVGIEAASSTDLRSLEITLQDLLARVLGIEDIYHQTFRASSKSLKMQIWCSPPHTVPPRLATVIYGHGPSNLDSVYDIAPSLREQMLATKWCRPDRLDFVNLPPSYSGDPTNLDECQGDLIPPSAVMVPQSRSPGGEWRMVGAIEGAYIPQPVLIYMTSFLLSSVARYRPDLWSEVVSPISGKPPGLRALIEEFYALALERFPLEALAATLRVDLAVWHHAVELVTS